MLGLILYIVDAVLRAALVVSSIALIVALLRRWK